MSSILSGSADIESVVSVDCEMTDGCKTIESKSLPEEQFVYLYILFEDPIAKKHATRTKDGKTWNW